MYAVAGLVLSLAGAALALAFGRRAASYYARDVYHMSDRSHIAFAVFSLGCAIVFAVSLVHDVFSIPVLAVWTLAAVLYGSSFLRGYGSD
jgi:O-antigen/teichoic acid export membrane protein